ncbi:MAG: ABC transporter permease [Peptococcaceae bacterium]|jgi:simple sugar transport system permease protein|nr:ABC transporter permease [Peptococcaceae bacterium]
MSKQFRAAISYAAIAVCSLLLAILLILLVGCDVGKAFYGFFNGILGSSYSVAEVFVKAAPLILAGLGVAVAFKSGFTNIGAEGQLYMGAVAFTATYVLCPGLPKAALLALGILAGFLAGGVWALIPGALKARFGISEVINTIMLNYIALGIVGILLQTALKDRAQYFPVSPTLDDGLGFSRLLKGTRLHSGILIALVCAVIVYFFIFKTSMGFRLRAVGMNPRACKCMGISVSAGLIVSSLLSGGLAGIAGVGEIAGLHHRLIGGISPSYGYLAIIVALLGGNHPLGVVIAATGIAALQVGALAMQRAANVPSAIASIIMGAVVLLILARKTLFKRLLREED